MKIDLPLGGSVVDPIVLLVEDLDSVKHSYNLGVKLVHSIYEGLRPYGIFVDIGHTEVDLRVRPKDVSGMKIWSAAFGFDVVLSQSHMYSRPWRVSAMTRPYSQGWEVTVSAGGKGDYRSLTETRVSEKDLAKVALRLIRQVDRQGAYLKPVKRAS